MELWTLLYWCYWIFVAFVRSEEEFSEELLVRPLPDGNVLAHFHFSNRLPHTHGEHHRLFPKAIFQLARKYRIRKMELSFTQGRWNYQKWGVLEPIAQVAAKPVGVELSASFDVPQHELDSTWGNLTNALSGLFCASTNFLQSPATYLDPWFSFRPSAGLLNVGSEGSKRVVTGIRSGTSGTRYGALPREAVCTENLTPWLKLLPCRDKAGLTTLLDRPRIYSGLYHSLRLVLRSGGAEGGGTNLDQTLTLVLRDAARPWKLSNWSLSELFGSELTGSCPLATTSKVYVELEKDLVQQLVNETGGGRVDYTNNPVLSVETPPDMILASEKQAVLLGFDVSLHRKVDPGLIWKAPLTWSIPRGPFYVSRFLTGSGNARGSMVIFFQANSDGASCGEGVDVTIFQMIPWYVRLYGHTLRAHLDGRSVDFWSVARFMRFTPAEARKSPAAIELALRLPPGTRVLSLTIEFDKGFLHIDEHPPDANRGFDLPAALVTFPGCQVSNKLPGSVEKLSPLFEVFQKLRPLQMYTEVLLLQLATPDFSMPYNVITLTCTVLALYFGSLLNAMRRRIGEEERASKSEEKGGWLQQKLGGRFSWLRNKKVARLLKIIAVVVIAIAVNHYSDS